MGQTRKGDFIGNYGPGKSWISSPYPKDDNEGKLYVVVAVDPAVVKLGTKLTIPSLPAPWNTRTFIATDTGQASTVKGKHVDIYTGTGKVAEQETFRITKQGHNVCLQ